MSNLFEDPFEEAKKLGLECILPEDNQLFIDLDDTEGGEWMEQMFEVLRHNGVAFETEKETTSKSGGRHVFIRFPKPESATSIVLGNQEITQDLGSRVTFDEIGRVALQACLGSDRKRELLSLLRIFLKMGESRPPTTFFEIPETAAATGVAESAAPDDLPF